MTRLEAWCRAHALRWSPILDANGAPAVRLEAPPGRRPARAMTLIRRNGDFCLIDEAGNALATSSGLQPMLDALAGGIAEPPRPLPPDTTPPLRRTLLQ